MGPNHTKSHTKPPQMTAMESTIPSNDDEKEEIDEEAEASEEARALRQAIKEGVFEKLKITAADIDNESEGDDNSQDGSNSSDIDQKENKKKFHFK